MQPLWCWRPGLGNPGSTTVINTLMWIISEEKIGQLCNIFMCVFSFIWEIRKLIEHSLPCILYSQTDKEHLHNRIVPVGREIIYEYLSRYACSSTVWFFFHSLYIPRHCGWNQLKVFTCDSTVLIKYSINVLHHVHYYCLKLIWLFRVCSQWEITKLKLLFGDSRQYFSAASKMGKLRIYKLCSHRTSQKNPNAEITCEWTITTLHSHSAFISEYSPFCKD